ncbi:hypothetical protein BDD12DRAFT_489419 [Trichophaea hybrida]|nr:hypothetical protein BDD12DRAFT_489419 [Trichophaea hybrida]
MCQISATPQNLIRHPLPIMVFFKAGIQAEQKSLNWFAMALLKHYITRFSPRVEHNDTIVKLYHDALLYLLWRANDNQMKISEESFNQYFSDAAATVEKKIAFLTDNIAAYCADGKTVKFKTWKKTGRPRFKGIPKLSACSVPWTPIENTKEKKRADRARIVTVSESLSSTIPSSRTVIEASDPPNPERVGTRLSDPIILDDTEQEQGNSCEVPPQRNASPVIIDLEPDLVEVLGNISQRRVHGRQSPEIILVSDDSASSSALSSPQLSPSPNFRSSSPMRPLRGSLSQEEFRRLTSDSGHDNCIVQSEDANRILKDFISANSDVFLREWRNVLAHLGMPCATQNVSQKRFRELGLSIEHVARTWIYDFPEFWRPVGMESQRVEAFVETFMDNWLSDSTDTITAPDNTPEDEGLNIEQRPEDVDHNTPAMAVQEGKLQPQIASPPPSPLLPSPPVDDEISHPVRRVIDLEGLDDQAPIAKSVIKPVIENNKPSQSQANIKVEQEMTPPETPPEDDEISPPVRYVINLDGLDNQAPITQSVIRQAKPVIENSKLSQPPTDIEAEHEMTTPETPPEDAASNRENQPLPPRMTDPFGLQEDDDEPSEIAGVLTSNKIPRKGRVVTTIGKVRSSAILTAKDFQLNDTLPKMRLEWQRTAWSSTRPLSFIAEARVDPVKNHTLVREKSLPRLKDEEQRIADKLIALDAEGRKLNDNYAEQLTSSLKVDWAKYQAVVQQQRAANEELSRRREKLSNDALTIAKATEQLKWTPDEMETPSTSMASASDSSDEVLLHGGFHRFVPPPRGPGERDEFLKDLLPWAKILDPSPPPLPRKRKYVRKKRRW